MQPLLQWLASNPYILLFAVVLGAVLLGKATTKVSGLGMVAWAIVVGIAVSASAATLGVRMGIDGFTKSVFLYLFTYGLGLRIGPSLIESLRGDGLKFTLLAAICSIVGLLVAVAFTRTWDLPDGTAAGILAGSMTMPAAIGLAEEAVRQGAFPPATRREARGRERHDRALLWPYLHLGHARHRPRLQVPAALVGHRRQGRSEEIRGAVRRSQRGRCGAYPATGRSRCGPTGFPAISSPAGR
jgi:AspT/YidE/YbjL antiporter-like protein